MTKKIKTSIVLSSLIFGAVSLSATPINIEIKEADTAGIQLGSEIENETYQNSTNISSNINLNLGQWIDGISGPSAITIIDNSILENKATINLKATSNQVANNYDDDEDDIDVSARGISLWNVKNKSIILNSGTISTDVTAKSLATSVGIEVVSANLDNSIVSNSEIKNQGTIKTFSKSDDSAISAGIVLENQILNSKIINGDGGIIEVIANGQNAHAEAMSIEFIDKSEIVNNGTIEANTTGTNSSDAIGIWIDYADNTQIENKGTILVNANGNGSGYFLSEAIGTGNLLDSTIVNSGTIKATRNNKLDKQGIAISSDKISLSINSNSKVTLTNTKDGKIYGNILMNAYNSGSNYGSFKNEGFISLPYNATKKETFTFDDDGTPTTISLQPNFGNLVNSGTIEIGAFKNSNDIIENTQIKTVTTTFEKGSKMQVAVVEGSKAFVKGDTLSEVVTASDKLTINDLTLNQTKLADNSALLDFEYKVSSDNHQLDLVVSKVESIKGVVTKPDTGSNINVNAGSIASILDELRNNQDKYPSMGAVLSKLDSLSLNQDVKKAVNSLLGMTSTSLIKTSSSINSSIAGIVSNRLGNIRSGLNSGDEIVIDNNKLWTKAYGSLGKQDDKDGISGFDLKTYGLGLGYDKEYKDGQVFGLGGFYTNANVETNGINQENDVDAYSIVAYGSNVLKDDKTTIYYQTSYSLQKNDSKRDLFTGDRANAKFTSKTFAIESKVGHKIALGEKASIEPSVGVSYRYFRNPDYTENGAGALNLKSEKFSNTELLGKIGAEFDYNLTNDSKLTANLGAGYDFHSEKNSVTSSFAGANGVTFDSKGIDNGRWKYEAGIGYLIDINNSNNLSLDYNYQGEGNKFRNNVVSVNYNYKF